MNEMLNYIFKNLRITENRVNALRRAMMRQKRTNQYVSYYMILNTFYIYIQWKEMEKMKSSIEELKNKAGGEKGAK